MALVFEKLSSKEVGIASEFVNYVFTDSVAKSLTQQGIETFQSVVSPAALLKRLEAGNRFLVCKHVGSIVGLGEVRDQNHLNLLFVLPTMQCKGIGRKLFMRLIRDIPDKTVTVNASLNSVDVYRKMGFKPIAEVEEVMGLRSQAMIYDRSS